MQAPEQPQARTQVTAEGGQLPMLAQPAVAPGCSHGCRCCGCCATQLATQLAGQVLTACWACAGVAPAAAKRPARKLDWLGQLRLQKERKEQAARKLTAGQGAPRLPAGPTKLLPLHVSAAPSRARSAAHLAWRLACAGCCVLQQKRITSPCCRPGGAPARQQAGHPVQVPRGLHQCCQAACAHEGPAVATVCCQAPSAEGSSAHQALASCPCCMD